MDDALHDLLMRRARVVAQVAQSGKGRVPRPGGRRRSSAACCARHRGALAAAAMVRIWRELLAGTTAHAGGRC